MAGGRPTKYDPSYCEKLVEHRAKGFSFESFAAKIDTCRKTLYNWCDEHPEFLHAKNVAYEKCVAYHEEFIHENTIMDLSKKFNNAPYIFMLKNVIGWTDKQEQEHKGEVKIQYLDKQDKDL